MKLTVPSYYAAFHCTASACRDNCCIGWEIDIDDAALARYRAEKGTFAPQLRAGIAAGEPCTFRMTGERCAFLNQDNLCEILLHMGEAGLCDICARHPRFADQFGDLTEIGLGLACEEAARLLFSWEEPVTLVSTETDDAARTFGMVESPCDEALLSLLLAVRSEMLAFLEREGDACTAARALLGLARRLDEQLFGGGKEELSIIVPQALTPPPTDRAQRSMAQCLTLFKDLESVDGTWDAMLAAACTAPVLKTAADSGRDRDGRRLLGYFLYRYFLKAVYDRDVLYPVKLAALALLFVRQMERGAPAPHDRAARTALTQRFSKELEYSEENMERVRQALESCEFLSTQALDEMLVCL